IVPSGRSGGASRRRVRTIFTELLALGEYHSGGMNEPPCEEPDKEDIYIGAFGNHLITKRDHHYACLRCGMIFFTQTDVDAAVHEAIDEFQPEPPENDEATER